MEYEEQTMAEEDAEKNTEKKKNRKLKIVAECLIYLALIFICIHVVPTYVIQRTIVSGESMQDTLQNGESLLIDKLSYRFSQPKRYDIIVFYPKGKDVDEYYVKRIYGLPGETVQIMDNDIYINNEKIEDPYAKDAMSTGGIANEPFTLAADEYFVLGDHRSVSQDSRFTTADNPDAPGPVKFENIVGKVILRIWPLNKLGVP